MMYFNKCLQQSFLLFLLLHILVNPVLCCEKYRAAPLQSKTLCRIDPCHELNLLSLNFCAKLQSPDWNLFSLSKNSCGSRSYIHIKASLTSCQLFLSLSRKKRGLRCFKDQYKMVVDILFLLAGLVFSLDSPAPSNSENR